MKCLRCGHCCKHLWVMIVDDPSKGVVDGNIIEHNGQGQPCKHLRGDRPGEYSCALHNEPWYEETPCARHEQVGKPDAPCRMGELVLIGQPYDDFLDKAWEKQNEGCVS